MRKKRRKPSNPLRILILVLLIAGAIYLERVIVPTVPPLFVPTATPTRSPAAILLEAESLYQAGQLEQAEAAYQEAIEVSPDQVNFYLDLAHLQALQGDLDQAETSARNALLIAPSSAHASAMLAWILDLQATQATDNQVRLQLLDQAREQIDKALAQNPDLAPVHAYHAEILIDEYIYAGEDTYQQALEAAQQAVSLDPNSFDAHRALAVVWEATGNYENALESYQRAQEINGNLSLVHLKLGDMYLALGDTDTAVERYVRASSLAPTDPVPLRRIVLAYSRVGQYARASQYAADAVRLSPTNPVLHGVLGQMYRKNNELERAVEELSWAIHGGTIPGAWTINGQVIELTSATSIEADLGVGDTVVASWRDGPEGGQQAVSIERAGEDPPPADDRILVGVVEDIRQPVQVQGLALNDGATAVELYYTYALALAETNRCDQAADIAQGILLAIQDDETARFNAEEALRICGDLETTPTPEVTATPEA
jgi:tetratricopeptide (TPR) repeat protein